MPLPFRYRLWFHLLSWLSRMGTANGAQFVVSSQVHSGGRLPAGDYLAWTRGKTVTAADLHGLIQGLEIPQADKDRLLAMTPGSYVGKAAELARRV